MGHAAINFIEKSPPPRFYLEAHNIKCCYWTNIVETDFTRCSNQIFCFKKSPKVNNLAESVQ